MTHNTQGFIKSKYILYIVNHVGKYWTIKILWIKNQWHCAAYYGHM